MVSTPQASGRRRSRASRLADVHVLLAQNQIGLRPEEMADLCGVSLRTIYRDLRNLDKDQRIQLQKDEHGRYTISKDSPLPPVSLTMDEAVAMLVLLNLRVPKSGERDQLLGSAYQKLAAIAPTTIADSLGQSIAQTPLTPRMARILDELQQLIQAWAAYRSVRFRFGGQLVERFDVYSIERSIADSAGYVIGRDANADAVLAYPMAEISDVQQIASRYSLPTTFNDRRPVAQPTVVLEFSPAVATRIRSYRWHPIQDVADAAGGAVRMTLDTPNPLAMLPWVLGWGSDVEVIAPAELRAQVAGTASRIASRYAPL